MLCFIFILLLRLRIMGKNAKKAFTLIELLVVISIIAMLLAILMPSLAKVKEMGKRVVCISNQRQLGMAWHVYAESNGGKMCSPRPMLGNSLDAKHSWIKWTAGGWPAGWTEQNWEDSIKLGALWDYAQSEDVFRCPAGERKERITYAGFAAMGWMEPLGRAVDGPIYKTITQIRQPVRRAVFIDEGKLTSDFFSVNYIEETWWDQPPNRHNYGVTMSFADGHAEYWNWADPRTRDLCEKTWDEFVASERNTPDNEDLKKVRIAAWGAIPK